MLIIFNLEALIFLLFVLMDHFKVILRVIIAVIMSFIFLRDCTL